MALVGWYNEGGAGGGGRGEVGVVGGIDGGIHGECRNC